MPLAVGCIHEVGHLDITRSRPNWITGPGPKSGLAGKSESRGPENGVSRWRRPKSNIYSQNHHFGLVYDMIYQFLGMEAKNYKFGMFCQQCHPSVASGDADIRPRNVSRIHTCHLFTSEFCLVLSWGVIHRPPRGVLTRMGCVRMGRGVSPTWPGPAESWRTRGRYTPRLRLAVSSTQ